MSYATIPVFDQTRILYRESHMKYMISSQERPDNIPMYSLRSDLNSFIMHIDENMEEESEETDVDLDLPHQLSLVPYDELDTQNYHDHEQLCLEESKYVPFEIGIEQEAKTIMYYQANCSNLSQTSTVTLGNFFRIEALEDLHITNLFET